MRLIWQPELRRAGVRVYKGEEDPQQEGERRCLENKGCPVMQIGFLGKEVALLIACS